MTLIKYVNPNTGAIIQIEADNQDHLDRMRVSGFVPYVEPVSTKTGDFGVDTGGCNVIKETILDIIDDNSRTHENTESGDYYQIITLLPEPKEIVVENTSTTDNSLGPLPDEIFTWTALKSMTLAQIKEISGKMDIKPPKPPHKDAFIRAILDKYEGR